MDRPVDNVEGRPQGAEGIAEVARIISRAGLVEAFGHCLLYTSDAADELLCVDFGGRRIIKKKQHNNIIQSH